MRDYSKLSDEELVKLFRAGDDDVDEYLMAKYKPVVLKRARALYLEGGDRDDLLQEGMLGLYKALKEYDPARGEASFLTFATTCIRNQMYKAIAAANRKKNAFLNEAVSFSDLEGQEAELPSGKADNPEDLVIQQEAEELLYRKIKEVLSPMENEVLGLYLDGQSHKEIGLALGKNEKAVENALQRIRKKVRAALSG